MSKEDDDKEQPIPPQIRVAFGVLYHARMMTDQCDASIPPRELSSLEKSVQVTALRAIQHYILGEMDFKPASAVDLSSTGKAPGQSDDAAATSVPND